MVVLIGELTIWAVSFLGFGSGYMDWERWFRLDRVGGGLWMSFWLFGEDLLKLIFEPLLDKSWNPHTGIVNVA